ncbi:E3 ubiquitin-protein ligase TRIM56 [Amphibalanus amphitrite]|uniref:E3 ubiquitin-protein ligase TRIM56 n=1 Tax=Amphibalanus amphitrite TaxID=1232801 RepID=A0A6A4WYQ4_AMPAM|nr:E3 ubiquitin-protein ligase TRIM56 [Amphibalanus amphitrite]
MGAPPPLPRTIRQLAETDTSSAASAAVKTDDDESAAPTDDVIVEEEATLEAGRAKGLLNCARCAVRLQHGVHEPRLLPACLHTLCQQCASGENEGAEVCCPLCRCVSPGVVAHPLLETMLLQSHEHRASTECGQCAERGGRSSRAAGTCRDCQIDLCHDCIQAHKITRATWGHKLELTPEAEKEDLCPTHGLVFDNYCDSCSVLCCRDCILSAHRSHQSCTLQEKLEGVRGAIRTGLEGVRYQDQKRSFFLRQMEACRRRHDAHSSQLMERLQAASLVDARAAHLEKLIGRLLECRRPTTSLHYFRHISNLSQRLLNVDIPEGETEIPVLSLRRVLGVDREFQCVPRVRGIHPMIALLLYEGSTCLQPGTKAKICHHFMTSIQSLVSSELKADSDLGLRYVRMMFRLIVNCARDMSPAMRELVLADPPARSWLMQQQQEEESHSEDGQSRREGEVDLDEPLVVWSGSSYQRSANHVYSVRYGNGGISSGTSSGGSYRGLFAEARISKNDQDS